jgi:hypothetical protein
MASLRKRIAKPGEFVIAQHGGIVGIVLAVKGDKKFGTCYKLACVGGPLWVFHDELSAPRPKIFEDLILLYHSYVGLLDRMAGLICYPGGEKAGYHVRELIFERVTAVVFAIAEHKNTDRNMIREVMLDFGTRAGFDKKTMAEGRAIMNAA